jgi:ketosteroid isomerase-like protein
MAELLIVVGWALSFTMSVPAASTQDRDAASVITELEERLAQAWVKRDRPFIDALLASDWTVIDQSGRTLTKQQVLEETFASAERTIDTMAVDDVRVRVFGPVAVVTGRTRATGSYQGRQASVALRFTDVFHFRDSRWQVVASQGTTITP